MTTEKNTTIRRQLSDEAMLWRLQIAAKLLAGYWANPTSKFDDDPIKAVLSVADELIDAHYGSLPVESDKPF